MRFLLSLILSAGLLLTNNISNAQFVPGALGYHEQALLFSNYNYNGSSRIQGIGNAQISLGGDLSLALSNPAGLGFYNRSEFSITPAYNMASANSLYIGNETSSSSNTFGLNSLGAVFNRTKSDIAPGKFRGGSFAITFTKINNFNSEILYSGSNPNNDILDFYVQDANIQNLDPAELVGVTYGAYDTYLQSEFLDAFIENGDTTYVPFYDRTFFSEYPTDRFPTVQDEIISSSGSQNQWSFSYGGNYNDLIYFGATLGLQSLRYNIAKVYTENYPGIEGDIVSNSILTEELITEGFGVNGTFGVTARPINQLTIGFSVITPTYLSMNEKYYYSTEANFNNFNMQNYGNYFDANYEIIATNPSADFTTFYESTALLNNRTYNEESLFDYTITTPLRLNAGTTFFISKHGFITADVEFVDYSTMKLKDNEGFLAGDQMQINSVYKSVVNLRAGGEWRIKAFRLRAGYNYQPSPYQVDEIDRNIQTISAGLGFRSSKFFLDLAGSYKQFNSTYNPYTIENPDNESYLNTHPVSIENTNLNIALSFGLFF